MEERELAERACEGDTAAYERLVRMHQAVAFRAAYLVTGDAPEAEDATQEAFIKAYRALHRFRPGAPFRPWLLAIVTNEARNRRRSAGRRANLTLRAAAESQAISAPVSPEAAVVAAERREELLANLGELSEGDRLVISYRYFLELSEEETATTLGCARGTLKSRLSRAIARLREAMAKEEDAGRPTVLRKGDRAGLEGPRARVEYPPTPDVARSVRLRLNEERTRRARRNRRWPPFLAPRLTAVAAALVLISVVALSPTVRATLSDFFVSSDQTSSEAGGSAARPEIGASQDRARQKAGAPSQAAGASAAMEDEGAFGCPSPSVRANPARAAAGETFRLIGHNFSSDCGGVGISPARGIEVYFLQAGETWPLATLDAGRNLTFDTRLRVPAGAEAGRATVRATTRSGEHVERRFLVLR